ncbi:glycosyltransferase family 4 protein [Candidatus Shapirobacteria bacterium]|nr:glycosyltransferase family 4 protein [Candidatus Shapirobacteria bacterium]
MKIGIDISQIVYGTGVSFYTKNLVENLLRIDKKNEYRLFFSSLRQNLKYNFSAKVKKFKIPPTLLELLWNQWHLFPVENFIGKVDVFHASDWTQPPTKAAKVTTIHDFGFLKYPQTAHPKIKAVMERRFQWIKKEIDLVIAVSKATQKDIMEILGLPEKKIKVVYEAAPEDLKPVKDKKISQKLFKKYNLDGDYLLSVATLEPRKNLKRIIEAFKMLKTKNLKLVITGKPGWEDLNTLGFKKGNNNTIFTGYLKKREDLAALYSQALGLVYPSLYEGFGLPILEAMKCGCPVLTSNISSMPEVAGQAAILVDPLDVEEIARGLSELVNNQDLRKSLAKKGLAQVKKFSWEKTAQETLKVYEQAVEK